MPRRTMESLKVSSAMTFLAIAAFVAVVAGAAQTAHLIRLDGMHRMPTRQI